MNKSASRSFDWYVCRFVFKTFNARSSSVINYPVTCMRAAPYKKLNFAILYDFCYTRTFIHLITPAPKRLRFRRRLFVCLFVCLFVNRITQILFNRLSQNSADRRNKHNGRTD